MKKLLLTAIILLGAPWLADAAYAPLPISAEDAAHVAAENLMRMGCRRIDTAASSAGTSGDWATLDCDDTGQLRANTEIPAAITPAATGMTVPASAPWVLAAMGCYNPVAVTMELCVGAANIAHDASASGIAPLLIGGYANAAAPTSVSADLDAVNAWFLRNGAQAMVLTAAGALIGGDATNGLDVDVTRVPTDPFGANADAASATGSISAKLRFIAATGIPITTFPDNEPFNVAQINGVAVTMGNGVAGTGVQRVTIASDSTGTVAIGTFPDNEPFNVAQINGVTPLMGNGASGTGAQRVTIANDSTGTIIATQATGSNLHIQCDAGCSGGTQYTQDAALTVATTIGTMAMGRASATVPADVTADNDAVLPWYLRSGALASQPTYGGVLAVAGNGVSGTGVQRVTLASDSTGQVAIASIAAGDTNIGNVDVLTVPADPFGVNADAASATGSISAKLRFIAATGIPITGTVTVGSHAVTNAGTFATQVSTDVVEDAAETAGVTGPMVLGVRRDVAVSSAGTTGDNATFNSDALGLLWTRHLDPCSGVAKTHIPISISTATTTELTAALSGASTFYYVCSIDLVTAAANNVALVDDNTDGCGSVTAGLAGGITAATGWNFAANGGLTKGNGEGTVFKAVTSNSVLCLMTSAATQLSGSIQVVAAP